MTRTLILIGFGLLAFMGILFLSFSEVQLSEDKWIRITSLVLMLAYLMVAFFNKNIRLKDTLKYSMIWIGFGLVIMVGYAYRFEFIDLKDRLIGNFFPSQGQVLSPGQVKFSPSNDGHFYVVALVEGVKIKFMVDTGASRVVLTARDAERLGYDLQTLNYNSRSSTANGDVWTAPISVQDITIASHRIENIAASVNAQGLDVSLLGMSYLEKLKGYQVDNGGLTFLY